MGQLQSKDGPHIEAWTDAKPWHRQNILCRDRDGNTAVTGREYAFAESESGRSPAPLYILADRLLCPNSGRRC